MGEMMNNVKGMKGAVVFGLATGVWFGAAVAGLASGPAKAPPDFTREKTFYVVPYAHLDTQWCWDYPQTINVYLKRSLEDNFPLMEKYPHYIYNLAGTWRYELMKEYYPEYWDKVKHYVSTGQWHPAGQQAEETDANVPSPESMIRNVLYGGRWLKHEFGIENHDYLLPDCFGFPASTPSVLAHCGLKGFSTQKLSWGSPIGIPFNVGRWIGPDGRFIIGALNATDYTGGMDGDFANAPQWVNRLEANGKRCGIYVDYRYFGVGDRGGACRESDLMNLEKSLATPGKFSIIPATSGRMYDDLCRVPEQVGKLPEYTGDLLLTEHSAGSLTSQAFMKRCNRKGELLGQGAEAAGVVADWLGAVPYSAKAFETHWMRLIASQFHDNLPGTSLPKCYDYCYNDDFIALKGFAAQLTDAVSGIAAGLKTDWCQGTPVVVFNPLALDREDTVEVAIPRSVTRPTVVDASGNRIPCQLLAPGKLLVLAKVPSIGVSVLDVREGLGPDLKSSLAITESSLENGRYRVTVNTDGDISSLVDKQVNRELLSAPTQIQFLYDNPRSFPAWNMDWADRQKPVEEVLKGPAKIRVVENGPVRVALEIERTGRNSRFVQTLRLTAGAGNRVEMATFIDWRGKGCTVKQAFPLTVSNPMATYNLGLGTLQRDNNKPGRFEAPSREWIDLTETSGSFGVSVLEDCKFGSDKPDDKTLRLTLLRTPHVLGNDFKEQQWQDWGRHEMLYGLFAHAGDGRTGQADRQGRRLNQPLLAFTATKHKGKFTDRAFLTVSTPQVDLRALKKAEEGGAVIVRLQELAGTNSSPVEVTFGDGIQSAWEVDGQEHRIGDAVVSGGKLKIDAFTPYACRAFAIMAKSARKGVRPPKVKALDLTGSFNADVISRNETRTDGDFSGGLTYPAEQVPSALVSGGIGFTLGSGRVDGAKNAVVCRGQALELPRGKWNEIDLLVAADKDVTNVIQGVERFVPAWNKPIGNWDCRLWTGNQVTGLAAGFVKAGEIAWFATHYHSPKGNEAYQFCYLTRISVPLAEGAKVITLPDNVAIKIFAATAVNRSVPTVQPAGSLYDDPAAFGPIQ